MKNSEPNHIIKCVTSISYTNNHYINNFEKFNIFFSNFFLVY